MQQGAWILASGPAVHACQENMTCTAEACQSRGDPSAGESFVDGANSAAAAADVRAKLAAVRAGGRGRHRRSCRCSYRVRTTAC
jgi:hypothetical protein